MPDPVWPVSLPKPLREGYGVSGEQNVERTEMEGGPMRVIRTGTANRRLVSVSLVLDATQLPTFWAFYDVDANDGADFVQMPIKMGHTLQNRRVRFASFPAEQLVDATQVHVSFQLETYDTL